MTAVADQEVMHKLARGIDHVMNEGKVGEARKGFFLATFEFKPGQPQQINYISNAVQPVVLSLMRELLKQLESSANDAGNPSQGSN